MTAPDVQPGDLVAVYRRGCPTMVAWGVLVHPALGYHPAGDWPKLANGVSYNPRWHAIRRIVADELASMQLDQEAGL
jgi:hypothetical protein